MSIEIQSPPPPPPATGGVSPQDRLRNEPYRFEFFQAVRLLRWIAKHADQEQTQVGADASPRHELVRFRSLATHGFPQGAIASLEIDEERDTVPEMRVGFMGLFGPSGVLPRHYTQLVIDRVRSKDDTLRDFLDLFNHRVISHFYQAWAKYRLPVSYEELYLDTRPESDVFTQGLYSLVGWGLPTVRNRLELDDCAFVYYGGHFAHAPRNAASLEAIVSDYFDIATTVQQFVGQWLYLDSRDQSQLSNDRRILANHCLGSDVVVGDRVWGVENNFRLRLGPMTYQQFLDLTPGGKGLTNLAQFVRAYVGASFDFDVQLVLQRDEVPECQLPQSDTPPAARLGWNTWLRSQAFTEHVDDAVFVHDGTPTRP